MNKDDKTRFWLAITSVITAGITALIARIPRRRRARKTCNNCRYYDDERMVCMVDPVMEIDVDPQDFCDEWKKMRKRKKR